MSPELQMLGSSPSMSGAVSEADTIMTYEDDDDEKDYVCFSALLPFAICILESAIELQSTNQSAFLFTH